MDLLGGKMKKKKVKTNKVYLIIKIAIMITLLVFSGMLEYSLFKCGFIPNKYLILSIIGIVILDGLTALLLFLKKIVCNVIGLILTIILCTIFCIGFAYINKTTKILNSLVEPREEIITYKVITDTTSECNDISCLKNGKIGILEQYADKLKEELSKIGTFEFFTYNSVDEIREALKNKEIDAMIITSSIYDETKEQFEDFEKEVKEVGETTVRTIIKTANSDIDPNEPFIIYISGIDSRDYSDVAAIGLSDVNIIAAVNPKTHKVLLVHTPRDFFVQLHGTTGLKDKLTHAGLYGIDMSLSTMEDLFGVKINAYMKVNFGAVIKIVDQIDGIDVYSDTAFGPFHIGMNHMNGEQALKFARQRKIYASGDRHRGQNQEAVITAIINKVSKDKKYLLKYNEILDSLVYHMRTNAEIEDVQTLVKNQLDTMSGWSVESIQVNGSNSTSNTRSFPRQYTYVMIPDMNTVENARNKIAQVIGG